MRHLATSRVSLVEWWTRSRCWTRVFVRPFVLHIHHQRQPVWTNRSLGYVWKTQGTPIPCDKNCNDRFLSACHLVQLFSSSSGIILFKTFVRRFNWRKNVTSSKPIKIALLHRMQFHACSTFSSSNRQVLLRRSHGNPVGSTVERWTRVILIERKPWASFNRCTMQRSSLTSKMIRIEQVVVIRDNF